MKSVKMLRKVLNSVLIAVCAFMIAAPAASAEKASFEEYQIKAAFLYNFAKFIEWPSGKFENAEDPIVICILGEDPFGDTLEKTVKGKTANYRSLKIKRLEEDRNFDACHILFISSSEKEHLAKILESARDSSVFTVGETEGFAREGGMLNFFIEENKIRFEINVDAAEGAGLKISSKLLKLAKIVKVK